MPKPGRVYKICSQAEWREALAQGRYAGSRDDARDGYIHLSAASQIEGVATRYFANAQALVVVTLDAEALGDALRWEPSSGGEEYPHFYGMLPTAQARAVQPLPDEGQARAAILKALT